LSPLTAGAGRNPTAMRLAAVALAVGINLTVFCAAPWLIRQPGQRSHFADSFPIDYIHHNTLAEEKPPKPPEPRKQPPLPPPPPPKEMSPPSRPKIEITAPPLQLDINPHLSRGPLVEAPPAPPLKTASLTGPRPAASLGPPNRSPLVAVRVPPAYPYFARLRGLEGWVRVRILVDEQGQVKQAEVVRAEPPGVFEDAVLSAVRRWRFRPGLEQGRCVSAWMETTVRFKLEENPS